MKTKTKPSLKQSDPDIAAFIQKEEVRQKEVLNMIPSENSVSDAVREASASVLMNKYSEGYPFKRYYQGNQNADQVESLAIERAKNLFGAEHVNVQPHSGSPANQAVFLATMKPGDTFMGLDLMSGGHLTHGSAVNFSGKIYRPISYSVSPTSEEVNLDQVRDLAKKNQPKLIISGWTAYPRRFDFVAFQQIADEVGAIHLADISHIAGLVAGGAHDSPLPFTNIVMTTTHKTLRGPRGAIIMSQAKFAAAIDKAVFPGVQGGPHEHSIAAKAVAFKEAASPSFRDYAHQTIENAKALADSLMAEGIKLVTNGTDTHLILVDLRPQGTGMGKQTAIALEAANICANANTVPFEPSSPFKPSGLRLGTPLLTTRGMKVEQMEQIGRWIAGIIKNVDDEKLQQSIGRQVRELASGFPLVDHE